MDRKTWQFHGRRPPSRLDKFADGPTSDRFSRLTTLMRTMANHAAVLREPVDASVISSFRQSAALLPEAMQRAVNKGERVANSNRVHVSLEQQKQAGAVDLLLESFGLNGGQEADGRQLPRVRTDNLKSLVSASSGLHELDSTQDAYNSIYDPKLSGGYRIAAANGSVHALMLPTRAPGVWLELTGNEITSPVHGDRDLNLSFVIAVAPKSPPGK